MAFNPLIVKGKPLMCMMKCLVALVFLVQNKEF